MITDFTRKNCKQKFFTWFQFFIYLGFFNKDRGRRNLRLVEKISIVSLRLKKHPGDLL